MSEFKIITLLKLTDPILEEIESIDPQIKVFHIPDGKDPGGLLEEARVIIGWPPKEWLGRAKQLQLLHLPSAGADGYTDRAMYANPDVIVTNSSGVYGIPIAEHVMGMCLGFARGLFQSLRHQDQCLWQKQDLTEMYGKTMGLIGLGDIGREIAKRAKAFGMKVVASKRSPSPKPDYVDELFYGKNGIAQIMRVSDYIVISLPLTPETEGIISREMLALCQPHAFIVNVGRGRLIDEPALIEALKNKQIAGAGLDVFVTEPLPADSPLWRLENVIITPHNAGSTPEQLNRTMKIFTQNLRNLFSGKPLINVVDLDLGY